MESSREIVKAPWLKANKKYGQKWKPPKLEECMKYFFNEDIEGLHDALIDVDSCRRVYFKLKEMGL